LEEINGDFLEVDFRGAEKALVRLPDKWLATELTPHSIETGMRLISDKRFS